MADKVGSRNPARSRYWHCWHCRRCSRCRRLFAPPLVLQIWAFTDLSPIISFALRLAGSCNWLWWVAWFRTGTNRRNETGFGDDS
jgi:hypothetical protein